MFLTRLNRRVLNIGLQGGGAHGAFTWGVLDHLLEDGRIRFDGISGTSAGAMNAVVLADGLLRGGAEGARESLDRFWNAVADSLPFEVAVPSSDGNGVRLAPGFKTILQLAQYFSPRQINPFDLNPLRDIVSALVDFERLRKHSSLKLFVAATNANSGKLRVFRLPEITAESVLASACLPTIHRPVEIDGEPYWDGGYAANPAVFPLFFECACRDILLVMLTPLKHKETPYTAQDIRNRMAELAFNSTFLREMRMFAHLRKYVERTWVRLGRFERRLVNTNFHVIEPPDVFTEMAVETKLAASTGFFRMLRDLGRERAKTWLKDNYGHVGKRPTVELSELFY